VNVEVLALIPARGGSKGIPRKNVLSIAGKPAIAYSIEQARASRHIRRVVVSTDDDEIAETALRYGAEVPFRRPAELAGDLSPDIDAFYHALATLREREGYGCDYVVHLRPPTILRAVEDIDEAIETIVAHPEADTLRSVTWAPVSPYKMWRPVQERIEPLLACEGIEEPWSMPRQLLPQVYWQNGYVDVIRSDVILERRRMTGSHVIPYFVDKDIPELDYVEDVARLEARIRERGLGLEPRKAREAI
jgi:N-acylneuraminate cytidylyltransferase